MHTSRIAELLQPFLLSELSAEQLDHISMYIDILTKWNQRINLTALRQPEEIVTRHFGESLFAARYLFPRVTREPASGLSAAEGDAASHVPTVVDVGSGAGFPGLPIKIWAPEVRLTLIESKHKKATFLKEVVRALGLEGVEVFVGRAENFPAATADVVTLRAVERFETVLPIATGLVSPRGRLVLLIGGEQIEQAKSFLPNLEWQTAIPVPLSNNRVLTIAQKQKALSRMDC